MKCTLDKLYFPFYYHLKYTDLKIKNKLKYLSLLHKIKTLGKPLIHNILKYTFGYDSFRGQQEEIINHTLDRKDALVIMPTGGGKSICYQIPALASEGITLVVSPLIALMNDQVLALKQLGVKADSLHSNLTQEESKNVYESLKSGELKLLYMSPERINNEITQRFLSTLDIGLIAIDEAHCVSVWGNDFRPDYAELASLRNIFPDSAILALTATADKATQDDIVKQLNLRDPKVFLSSFERKNITTYIENGIKRIEKIKKILRNYYDASGIIYCLSRRDTENVAKKLVSAGYKAVYYHAGLDSQTRSKVQREFQNDEVQIICATIAFGMGIDKPNIRFVIHYNMPKNLEAYYQEIGRAGRDGENSEAIMFYSWGDYIKLKRFIDEGEANEEFKKVQRAKLDRMWEYSSSSDCRTNLVLNYFGEYRSEKCGHCDNCLNPPIKKDGTTQAMMALSAIKRCNEKLGIELLVGILKGSYRAEIKQNNCDKIKTFGVGRNISGANWKNYIIQMINQGIINIDYTNSSNLRWTPLSKLVLENKLKVDIVDFVPKTKEKKPVKLFTDKKDLDNSLLAIFKKWRIDLARKNNMPAYIILSNKTLDELCRFKPTNKLELLQIIGIGEAKLKKYGNEIIKIIYEYQNQG